MRPISVILLLAFLLVKTNGFTQQPAANGELYREIKTRDSLLFNAFNTRDTALFN